MKYDSIESEATDVHDATPPVAVEPEALNATANSLTATAVPTHARIVLTSLIGLAVILFGLVGGYASKALSSAQNKIIENNQGGLLSQLLTASQAEPLKGEKDDRINILLLGYGGAGHQGGGLTDTIMVMSIKPSTHEVVMISIPRDLVVNFGGKKPAEQEWRKINYALDFGGIKFAKEKVEEVLGLPIQYYVSVDFEGFRQVIDDLGGVNVYVDNAFTDREYPDYNYGYQTISFQTGWQVMSGERALQFARSRHGNHGEGSDFARSHRQEIILDAVRAQLLSAGTLLNPSKLTSIFNDLGDHIKTDAQVWEMIRLSDLAKDVSSENIISKVIDQGEGGFLESEIIPETGAYVLIPVAGLGDYSEIQNMASTVFDQPELVKEEVKVVVQNGTKVSGLGARTAEVLRNNQIEVTTIANAAVRDKETTLVFDLTGGTKPTGLAQVVELLHVTPDHVMVVALDQLDPGLVNTKEVPPATDFVVVLGTDYSLAEEATNTNQ